MLHPSRELYAPGAQDLVACWLGSVRVWRLPLGLSRTLGCNQGRVQSLPERGELGLRDADRNRAPVRSLDIDELVVRFPSRSRPANAGNHGVQDSAERIEDAV